MEKIKVSVIVPNYNHAPFLEKRLGSIFNQTFQDFEVILLDDASTDNSVEILNKYAKHTKVSHYVINKENSGSTFKQWEKGIKLAKGEFIWIAESDDWADKHFLEEFSNHVDKIDLFASKSFIVEKQQTYISPDIKGNFQSSGAGFVSEYLICGNMLFNASAVIFKKSKIPLEIFNKIQDYKYSGDWIFWIAFLLNKSTIFYADKPLNYFNRTIFESSKSYKEGRFFTEGTKVIKFIKQQTQINQFKTIKKLWTCWIGHYKNRMLTDDFFFSKNKFYIIKLIFIKNFDLVLLFVLLKLAINKIIHEFRNLCNYLLLQ